MDDEQWKKWWIQSDCVYAQVQSKYFGNCKKLTSLDKKMVEVNQYDDLINHATGNISAFIFDLDDGVKVNYAKFLIIDGVKSQNLLVPIKL